MDLDQRFWQKVQLADNGCWLWTGAGAKGLGYGRFRIDRKSVLAHRWLFQRLGRVIPQGLELDHLCRTPQCVNPDHLEPISHRENNGRGAHNWHPTRCPKGHEYSEANTILRKAGWRECKTCKTERKRAWRAKRRQWILKNLETIAAKEAMKKL